MAARERGTLSLALGMALSAALAFAAACGRSGREGGDPRALPAGGEAAGGSYEAGAGAEPMGTGATTGNAGSAFVSAGSGGTTAGGTGPDVTDYRCLSSSDCPFSGACRADGFCECPAVAPTYCSSYSVDFQAPGCVSLLNNRGRCGACDKACPAYTACREGQCSESPTLVADLGTCGSIQGLAIVGTDLYHWSTATDSIGSVSIEGSAVAATASLGSTLDLAADESALYWLATGEGRSIMRRPLAAGEAEVLAAGSAGEPITDFTVHDGSVYYARGDEIHALSMGQSGWADSAIVSSPPGNLPHWLVAGADFVIWYDQTSLHQDDLVPGNDGYQPLLATFAEGIALDGEHLYWWRGELLDRLKLGTTESELVARVPGQTVESIAFGSDYLYMASGKVIYRQPRQPTIDGAPLPVDTFALTETPVLAIVLSAQHLYWAAGCKLHRLPL